MKNIFASLVILALSASAQATTVAQANSKIQQLFNTAEQSSVQVFCGNQPDWQCRTIHYMKDKATGAPVNAFWTTFSAPGRRAGGVHYFVAVNPNQTTFAGGEYEVYSYQFLDASLKVSEVYANTRIVGTYGDLREISNDTLAVLGTPNYVRKVKYTIGNGELTIEGTIYDGLTSPNKIGEIKKTLTERKN